jgi:hypothetical protein
MALPISISVPTPAPVGPPVVVPYKQFAGGLTVSRKPNKGLSKYRKGFPVKLSKEHHVMLHITYVWLQKHGQTTPALDELILLLPPYQDTSKLGYRERTGSKTLRIRGPEVLTLVHLLEEAQKLPFRCSSTFRSRVRDLKALNPMDLMVDAQRE